MTVAQRRRPSRLPILPVVVAGLLLPAPVALGHDFSITDVVVLFKTDGTYLVDVTVDCDALALGVSPQTDSAENVAALEALSPAEREEALERARETLVRRLRLRFDGERQRPVVGFPMLGTELAAAAPVPTLLGTTARLSGVVPAGATEFSFGASRTFKVVHLTILDQATTDGVRHVLDVAEDSPPYRLGEPLRAPVRSEVAGRYTALGFAHILPRGLDHILFVLGLYLLCTRLRPLLWQVTAFTVAHTATLALSMYGVVELPAPIVEPLIALSIAYVAIENTLTRELKPWRPLLVFGFGLLHGLGFAGVLRELGLPAGEFVTALVAFNVGVELGQLAVLLLAFLAVGWLRERAWYRRAIVVPASLLIAAVGLWWTIDRAFLG